MPPLPTLFPLSNSITSVYTLHYTSMPPPRRQHRLYIRSRFDQDEAVRKPDLRLTVPDALKVILVDDWESVTKNNQVCSRNIILELPV